MLNFTQIGAELGKTSKAAANLCRKYEDQLQGFLVYADKKKYSGEGTSREIIGLTEEGLEELRQIAYQRRSRPAAETAEIQELKHRAEIAEIKLAANERLLQHLERETQRLTDENTQLKAELKELNAQGFFRRLLGYKKQ